MNATIEAPQAAKFAPKVSGRFTVQSTTGAHRTFQISFWSKKDDGPEAYTVGILVGPDNTASYKNIGFLDLTQGRVRMYKKQAPEFGKYQRMLEVIIFGGNVPAGVNILNEEVCRRCHHPLTTPTSITLGIGPDCLGRE